MNWTKLPDNWWRNEFGDQIHRYEILDDEDRCQIEYHLRHAGERLPWSGKTHTLAEAQRQLEQSRALMI